MILLWRRMARNPAHPRVSGACSWVDRLGDWYLDSGGVELVSLALQMISVSPPVLYFTFAGLTFRSPAPSANGVEREARSSVRLYDSAMELGFLGAARGQSS